MNEKYILTEERRVVISKTTENRHVLHRIQATKNFEVIALVCYNAVINNANIDGRNVKICDHTVIDHSAITVKDGKPTRLTLK